jgi:hypothetical protein
MKSSAFHSGTSAMFLIFFSILSHGIILGQDQNVVLQKQQDKWTFNLPHHGLTPGLVDTVRPTLSNLGKGLLHYDFIILKDHNKMYLYQYREEDKPVMIKANLNDLDLEILQHNMHFIEKQYQIQIKEWIREDKWDLNLGEAIKGFYMKPIY